MAWKICKKLFHSVENLTSSGRNPFGGIGICCFMADFLRVWGVSCRGSGFVRPFRTLNAGRWTLICAKSVYPVNTKRIILISTDPPDRMCGSMARYAGMVREALETQGPGEYQIEDMCLSPRQSWLERWPVKAQTLVRYGMIAFQARRRLPAQSRAILHLLDGSHAYLLGAVRRLAAPLVVTVHDCIPLLCLHGELGGQRVSGFSRWLLPRVLAGLRRADAWVADSANTREDLVRLVGVDERAVYSVPPAKFSFPAFHSLPSKDSRSYMLHVSGNNNFYKNRSGVIDVFQLVRKTENVRLIMAGAPPDRVLQHKIAAAGVESDVEFQINISESQLAGLYQHAALLLFPSYYEGFGWPPLEAMGCGCPVVCSHAGSLPEVVGSAALMAAPTDISGLAEHCRGVLRDSALRARLVAAGREQAARFTLERMGAGLLTAYVAAEATVERREASAP